MNLLYAKHKARYGTLYNLGGSSDSSNQSSSSNTSNTNTTTVNSSTSNNTTNSSTYNSTNTSTQDRRQVTDHGISTSADNSTVSYNNSGNSTTNSYDNHVTNNISTVTDYGSVQAALNSNTEMGLHTLAASTLLNQTGADMLKANIDYLQHLSDSNANQGTQLLQQMTNANNAALAQVSAIAAKPLNAQDPQHILVIVGLVVFGIFVFKGKV